MTEYSYFDPALDCRDRALKVLALITAEFQSDPMSVQCFDQRTVTEAVAVVREWEKLERRGEVPPLLTEGRRRA